MKLEDINSLPILQVLDKLGIAYKRESNAEYVLQRSTGEFANGRKANIVKNVIGDFSHGDAGGKIFGFVLEYLKLDKEQTFERFEERFGGTKPLEFKQHKPDIPIQKVWDGLPTIDISCQEYLATRLIEYDRVKNIVKGFRGGIACLIYRDGVPVGANVRTLETEHHKRFIAIPGYGTEGLYMHELDVTKNYVIVVEGLIDFLTLRQFDTNVVGLKSNKGGLEEVLKLSTHKTIYFVPDNDRAGQESVDSLGLTDYYLFRIDKHANGNPIKDINDLAVYFGGADLLSEFIRSNAEHIQKPLEAAADDVLAGIDGNINDKLNTSSPSPFTFGLKSLDNVRGRFDYGQLHAVIGESGSGKTTFTFFQAMQNAKINKVLYVSLEMKPDKLIALRARKLAGISAEERSNKTFTPMQLTTMQNRIEEVQKHTNLSVVGANKQSVMDIDKVLENLLKYVAAGYRLIYIDNLGFVEGKGTTAVERINDVIRKFQKFVQSHLCTIVLIHHFNKGDRKSRNSRGFEDVMGTAKLEHDIDYGIFVTRDTTDWEELTEEERATTYIEVKKDRENGIIRRIPIFFRFGGYQDTF